MDRPDRVIVCGIDGSAAGRRAAEWAADEARRRGCRLRAVTVWSWDGLKSGTMISSPAEARRRAEDIQHEALDAVVGGRLDPPIEGQIVQGRPSEQLCRAALDAELLVLGSRGHGAFPDALGSTSQHVIHRAPCPVVVLPQPRPAQRD